MLAEQARHGVAVRVHAAAVRREERVVGDEVDARGAEPDIGVAGIDRADADPGAHVVARAADDRRAGRHAPARGELGAQRAGDLGALDQTGQLRPLDPAGGEDAVVPVAGRASISSVAEELARSLATSPVSRRRTKSLVRSTRARASIASGSWRVASAAWAPGSPAWRGSRRYRRSRRRASSSAAHSAPARPSFHSGAGRIGRSAASSSVTASIWPERPMAAHRRHRARHGGGEQIERRLGRPPPILRLLLRPQRPRPADRRAAPRARRPGDPRRRR